MHCICVAHAGVRWSIPLMYGYAVCEPRNFWEPVRTNKLSPLRFSVRERAGSGISVPVQQRTGNAESSKRLHISCFQFSSE